MRGGQAVPADDVAARWGDLLARHRAVPWALAALFAIAGLLAVRANTFLNNEGILTWIFAGEVSEWPLDGLFFLKLRPPLSFFYAPVAVLGLTPFLCLHTLIAATAIPLLASLARRFGHRSPNLPALLLALSPLFVGAAPAGVQNGDALLALLAVTWLLNARRPTAAGVLLTWIVLSRIEVAFFGVALAAYALATPGARRFVVAAAALATVYVLAGAVYHGDLLWPLHYPAFPTANPAVLPEARAHYGGDLKDLVAVVLALTPAIPIGLWASWRAAPRLEVVVSVAAIAYVVAIRVLPLADLVYVDASPRYVLPALPYLCLVVGRGVEHWGGGWRATVWRCLALVGVGAALGVPLLGGTSRDLTWFDGSMGVLLFVAVAACVATALLAMVRRRAAVALLIAVAVFIGWIVLPTTHLFLGGQARMLDESMAWILAQRLPPDGVVVTDHHLLGVWMADYAPAAHTDVRHLITPEMAYDRNLANPATRQAEIMFHPSRFAYAPWIDLADVAKLPGEVLVVMREDIQRTNLLSEPPLDRVEWLEKHDTWIGGRLRREN
jgi:hypothetical protein